MAPVAIFGARAVLPMGVLFLEDHARLLLVLHTVLAVAAVATSTLLVVWLARVRRGAHGRLRAVRRFAVILAVLHGAAFDVRDGRVLTGPASRPLAMHHVRIVGDRIEVALDPQAPAAATID